MEDLWRRLEAHLAEHAPAALACLNPPASKAAIRHAEAALGMKLPADLAASLRVHDGQPECTGWPPPIGLVPAERYQRQGVKVSATWGELASLDHIVSSTLGERGAFADLSAEELASFEYDGPVRRDGDWSWIVFVDPGSGDRLGLDLNPADGGQFGQVLSIVHDPDGLFVLAPSYRAWFERLVERYESGQYAVVERNGMWETIDSTRQRRKGK